jgi:tetratricopeptide (TPR) repeat protein
VPIDRAAVLRSAEKLLRQGRLEHAIAEYTRIVEDQPQDWNTANLLGDLFLRCGKSDKAIEQFIRVANHLNDEGFITKASAVYKKVLKLDPHHEHALVKASEIARRQGLLADERAYLAELAESKKKRGDARAAAEISSRIESLYSGAGRYATDLASDGGVAPLAPIPPLDVPAPALPPAREETMPRFTESVGTAAAPPHVGERPSVSASISGPDSGPGRAGSAPVPVVDPPAPAAEVVAATAGLGAMQPAPSISHSASSPLEPAPAVPVEEERERTAPALELDLSAALDNLAKPEAASGASSPSPPSLDAVFSRLRLGATRVSSDEARKHLDRGIELNAAGDADGAIAALMIAARSPRCQFAAASRLARIYRERGFARDAVEWFERAAEARTPSSSEGFAVMYELADALEECGEPVRALAVCLELQVEAGDYRSLSTRIARLANART